MLLNNRYSSLTRIASQIILENKKNSAHNYRRTAAKYFFVVLRHSPKASCAKHWLVTKRNFFKKWASTLALGIFSISETNRFKDSTVSIRYISIIFDRKFNTKKPYSLFLSNQTQKMRNTSKAFHVWIN